MHSKLTDKELDLHLTHMDLELNSQGLPLRFRALQCFKSLHGPVPDGPLREALFEPILVWFSTRYGDRVNWDGVIGRVPVILRGDVYLVQVPLVKEDAIINFTDRFEGLAPNVAESLLREEFEELGRKVGGATLAFMKLYNLSVDDHFLDDVERAMVWRALFDLESASHCLKLSGDTQKAVFEAHAAAEKFLKVGLKRSGSNLNLQKLGHKLNTIFKELVQIEPRYIWMKSSIDSLQAFAPNMQIRYQMVPRTIEDAVSSFHAALHVCGTMAQMWLFDAERGTSHSDFVPGRFYVDGRRWTYYCKEIRNASSARPLAILTLFRIEKLLGHSMLMDVRVDLGQSALHLEVKDPNEIAKLRIQYDYQVRHPGRPVQPEELGIQIVSGPEGSYTTGSLLVERGKVTKS
jgi:hypothetical protein